MVSHISHLTIDAHDPYLLSRWWSEVLDFHEDPDDPNLPDHEECMIFSADGAQKLLFITVPDDKIVKNRLHLDLRPTEGDRDAELARLLSVGATQVADRRTPEGRGWVVLADPEGNEFCILRSVAEAEAHPWPDAGD
jgi:predicted enzyme related to lactoylglutathione lyase